MNSINNSKAPATGKTSPFQPLEALSPVALSTPDGLQLEAFHLRVNSQQTPKHLAIIFAPNGENARNTFYMRDVLLDYIHTNPPVSDYLFVNYRGVGGSKGRCVSLKNLIEDGEAAMQWAQGSPYPGVVNFPHISLHGTSLGGGVASALAQKYPRASLTLVHTFSDFSKATHHLAGKLFVKPVAWFVLKLSLLVDAKVLATEESLKHRALHLITGPLIVRRALYDSVLGPSALTDQGPYKVNTYQEDPTDHLFKKAASRDP